ncbi:MAG TPA: TetR/AcrR family transcriptional regulator [Actinomycetota bacterium]|nr:TetR/AcrR family transcriptional regulator [Actinomycetota bacterium]
MPRLWMDTIAAHRREVRDAILDTAAALVSKRGLLSVTMSQIADETGIGRATLYKYFPDVEAIIVAWHEQTISGHLQYLAGLRDQAGDPRDRLNAVLEGYAFINYEHHGSERQRGHLRDPALAALLHKGGHVARAYAKLRAMVRDLIAEGARAGEVREDIPPDELAAFSLSALESASGLSSKAAVRRLVGVTLAGLEPYRSHTGSR